MSLPSNIAIQTTGLAKAYRGRGAFKGTHYWALKPLDLEVPEGSALGILGANGAGKSTLLKLLSGLTHPTAGGYQYQGQMTSLLEVGTGFHPDLSGRENVYLSGALHGMTRTEMAQRMEAIQEFAGLHDQYMDHPIKHYSSGMKVRLGFSVAAHLHADILVVDEVLAVGDASFQAKCLQSMEAQMSDHGRTVLFVSHNLYALQTLCPQTLWLERGEKVRLGPSSELVTDYLQKVQTTSSSFGERGHSAAKGSGKLRLTDLEWMAGPPQTGVANTLRVAYEGTGDQHDVDIRLNVHGNDGRFIAPIAMHAHGFSPATLPASGELFVHFEALPFMEGWYHVDARATERGVVAYEYKNLWGFQVAGGGFLAQAPAYTAGKNGVHLRQEWRLEP
jgi:lipopolysaccharide transport system ATP-binding protein